VSDALRFEVAAFGIDVIVVEPGIVRTGFSSAAVTALNANQEANQDAESNQADPYADFNASVEETTLETYVRGPVARLGGGPETVARVVERAITARRPRTRYRVTAAASLLIGLRRVVSDRVWDRLVATGFRQPTPP
jgi:NAD(P)-dependent dehydrogenase (short-subunit alcohol dehydrogenase family)